MLEGLTEEEAGSFLQENPTLAPLYEIEVVKDSKPYQLTEEAAIVELGRARKALERELVVSQRVRPTELEELNLDTVEEPRNVLIAKELDEEFKEQLTHVLRTYKDVFAWSYEDMKGLNPKFYHHKINLAKDAIPVQQRRYRLNPNYAAKVKQDIDKLLQVGFIRPVIPVQQRRD
jgi:hypothetical protein